MDKNCSIYRTMDLVGKRWTLPLILEIYKSGEQGIRFNSIKRSIPEITSRILSMRLKELEDKKMIYHSIDNSTVPSKSIYFLTPCGKDFIKVIAEMKLWTLKWAYKNKICEEKDCKNCS